MANTIKIKRRPQANGAGVPNNLSPGELAFSEADAKLYYGLGPDSTATPIEIGGSGYVLAQISNNAPTKTGSGATGTWNISVTGNAGTVTNGVYTSRSLTAGSGLVGGGDLSSNRTFDIGQGDGISVSADSIAVNNTVVRTSGVQSISGVKTFANQPLFNSGIALSGTNSNNNNIISSVTNSLNRMFINTDTLFIDTTNNSAPAGSGGVTIFGSNNPTLIITNETPDQNPAEIKLRSAGNGGDLSNKLIIGSYNVDNYYGNSPFNVNTNEIYSLADYDLSIVTESGSLNINALNNSVNIGPILNIDNLRLDGNTISSSNNNGNITILPTGQGTVFIGQQQILEVSDFVYMKDGITEVTLFSTEEAFLSDLGGKTSIQWDQRTLDNESGISVLYWNEINGIGIKKAYPAYTLDVNGSGNFASGLYVNNTSVSVSGHSHSSSDITNFNSSVSGLVSGLYVPVSRSITPGSGLVGSSALDLSANRTLDVGQGDGITVSADAIAVNNTVVRTNGNQDIFGIKKFFSTINVVSGMRINYDESVGPIHGNQLGVFYDAYNDEYLARFNTNSNSNSNFINLNAVTTFNKVSNDGALPFVINPTGYAGSGAITQGFWRGSAIEIDKGGTGRTSYSNGQLLIGSGNSLAANTLSSASGIGITNGSGTITIAVTGIPSSSITNFNSSVNDLIDDSVSTSIVAGSGATVVYSSGNNTLTISSALTAGSGITLSHNSGNYTINNSRTGSTSVILSGVEYQRAALTGDVTASQNNNATTIANDAVTNAKAANMAANTIKGRITAGTGDPEDLTAANVRTILNVADGANNYVHPTDGANTTIASGNLKVLSAITVNNLGHVTSVSSKDLTANDIPNLSTDKLTSGTLGVGRGGTGAATLTANNILVGNGTSAISAPYSVETTLTGGASAIPRADAVKTYVDNLLGANDAMVFKGTIGTGGTVTALPTTHQAGWSYRVITADTYAGKVCEIGDLIIAVIDRSGSSNTNDDWTVVQTNIDGAVVGPASSTDNALAVFNGTTGKLIKNSSFIPTTVGGNLINLTNPSASGFIRINADNTVATRTASEFRSDIGVNDATLTLNVSGTGLSGSQTFTANQSTGATFTVTSNATAANTASAVVARDSSGNFSAGTITATGFVRSGGTSSQFLKADGTVDSTAYTTNVGTVTSVGGTGSVAGLTLTGAITTTGNLTLGGTLSTPVSTINDSTTVGQNLVKLTNPSAIRFLRINADNSVSSLSDSDFRTAIGAGTSSTVGTVTSVTAGSGMNFTSITSSGPVTLGTPSDITLSTANSLTSNSHTHAFAPGGNSGQYIRGDGVLATLCDGIANCTIDGGTF